jgi:purine-binding chemotaxis protein CheW
MTKLLLLVTIAGERVALPAETVEAVVEIGALTPVPRAPAHVAGLAALRSRVLTVIDCRASLGLGRTEPASRYDAVVVGVDGQPYALLVDSVEDTAECGAAPTAVRSQLHAGWAGAATGMIELEGVPMLLIDPASLVAGSTALAA